MSFSNYLENKLLDHLFGKASFSSPTIYVALSKYDPGEDGAGLQEPSPPYGYARKQTSASDWEVASNGILRNATTLAFPQASGGNWGTISHFALFDASSGGNLLLSGTVTPNQAINDGQLAQIAAGQLSTTLD